MSFLRLIIASLLHHARMNLVVACGVATATAVLSGALLVGDSMRASLRHMTLDRLGRVEEALVADRFFRASLAAEALDRGAARPDAAAVPVIMLRGSLENDDPQSPARANQVNLFGCDAAFWQLGSGRPTHMPGPREVVLNRPLAEVLHVTVGDAVSVRLPRSASVPADSLLGERRDTLRSVRLTVCEVIAAEGLGRFGLRPTTQLPRNAYLPLATLQRELAEADRVNAILLSGPASPKWQPRLADFGIHITEIRPNCLQLTSERMLLEPAVEKSLCQQLARWAKVTGPSFRPPPPLAASAVAPEIGPVPGPGPIQPLLTYLANSIACGHREIPYSTITALDFAAAPPLGPFVSLTGKAIPALRDDEIVLNSWAAAELKATPGDTIRVTYFDPASTHGHWRQKTAALRLAAVTQLAGAADDRQFTPTVQGVTNATSMADWNPPFDFDARRIRHQDEKYWREHGPAPKAFVSLATGRKLWASRFGDTTAIRIAVDAPLTAREIQRRLVLDPAAMAMSFQPVREQGLTAAAGTTPFSVLFLAFSSFLIAAALMLVALLFRLGIDRRAAEIGLLLAVGLRRAQAMWLLAGEGLLVAAGGSLLGVAAGIGYAAAMLLGLRTWWLPAVGTPQLHLSITWQSLLWGFASGWLVAFAAMLCSTRRLAKIAPRRLLARQTEAEGRAVTTSRGGGRRWLPWLLVAAVVVPPLVVAFAPLDEAAKAGAFFGVAALALTALLALAAVWLRGGATIHSPLPPRERGTLLHLAMRNAARHVGRSTLTMGLVAAACFLIVAVGAFRLDPAREAATRDGGSGGFSLVAQSDQPLYQDLNTHAGRVQLGFSSQDDRLLAGCEIFSLRVKPGDDASCLNLYQPRQPRVLGLPAALVQRGGFAWAARPSPTQGKRGQAPFVQSTLRAVPANGACPLFPTTDGPGVPVVMDLNTANYSLHLWQGLGETYDLVDGRGKPLRLRVAGLLADSIFQGDLLLSEDDLLHYDPEVSGYRFFLIDTRGADVADVRAALDRTLGDYGFTVETAVERLARFSAVENTYLSAFQSLGGLGLLLGTMGLAAVQLRHMLERRGELALLRAVGFRHRTLAALVMLESACLLITGLAIGTLAALIAVLPQLLLRAGIPWVALAAVLAVAAVGLAASWAAAAAMLRAPLNAALREER